MYPLSSMLSVSRLGVSVASRVSQKAGHRFRAVLHLQQRQAVASFTTLGLLRESYDKWERRTPLTPRQVEDIIASTNVSVLVQPSSQRIFSDQDFATAGAILTEDLSKADICFGVKRPKDTESLLPNKTYLFFSHTIKGQPENMSLLQDCLDKHIQLFDYERMLLDGKRLVAFGHYAGMAGAIDSFAALGKRLLYTYGISTPLLTCPPAWMHASVHDAKEQVLKMGNRVAVHGIPTAEPLVIAVTGKGGCVHKGAMEILDLVPHTIVSVDDLPRLYETTSSSNQHSFYICPVATSEIYQRTDGSDFDRHDFAEHPVHYRSLFGQKVAPYAHAILNCVYWDARFPRLLTKKQMKRIYENDPRLLLVADISCDVNGSIEFLERTTTIEKPFFQYDPRSEREIADEIGSAGVTVMGVDILPAELPRDSSEHFGRLLVGVAKELIDARASQSEAVRGVDTALLSPTVADACITTAEGKLSPGYRYLNNLMHQAPKVVQVGQCSRMVSLEGHLFDSGLINQILDVIEQQEGGLEFKECLFPPHSASERHKSSVLLQVTAPNEVGLEAILQKMKALVDLISKANASMVVIEESSTKRMAGLAQVETKREHQVLLLGAGRVSKALVDYLGSFEDVVITVASENESDARLVASSAVNGRHLAVDAQTDLRRISGLIEGADVVISMLPAPMHPLVAQECILHKSHLVTASYESPELRELEDRIVQAGIVVLNEVGLDPGLDHMSAMKIIDDIKERDGSIVRFSSVCGGLPAPECAGNPMKYKFSWSPRGVIRASQNAARYRWEDKLQEVRGYELLGSAAPFVEAWPDLRLECLPNRDSLLYEEVYNIQGASTVFRGTLRYKGFSKMMDVFQNMGLFDSIPCGYDTWPEVMNMLRMKRGGFESLRDFVEACANEDVEQAMLALDALEWLGAYDLQKVDSKAMVVDAFCDLLQQRLTFEPGERDMVLMHHVIEASFRDGSEERHFSSLQVFGDSAGSAMAKTVGYTTAASARLLLDGGLRNERGLLLPTTEQIYGPVLSKLEEKGVVFDEHVSVHLPAVAGKA